jgi:hypothetical protein
MYRGRGRWGVNKEVDMEQGADGALARGNTVLKREIDRLTHAHL